MRVNKPFVIHGRWDNKYLGSEPQFQYNFRTFEEAEKKFYELVNRGAGTIFLEEYDDYGNQIACYNHGHTINKRMR